MRIADGALINQYPELRTESGLIDLTSTNGYDIYEHKPITFKKMPIQSPWPNWVDYFGTT